MSLSTQNPVGTVETISCTRPIEKVTVSHMFKIMGYSLDKEIGKGQFIESTIFTVGGYDWTIKYYPNGCNEAEADDISIYLSFKSKSEGVKAQVDFNILDKSECALPLSQQTQIRNFSTVSDWGSKSFCKRAELERNIKDDCFVIQSIITVFKVFPVEPTAKVVIPVDTIETIYCTRPIEKVTVSHMFKIMGYSLDKEIGKGKFIESTIFTVGGYDWTIGYYPNGSTEAQEDDISLYLYLNSKSECEKAQVTFTILDQYGCALPLSKTTRINIFKTKDDNWGFRSFCKRAELERNIKDDCFVINSAVTVFNVLPVKPTAQVVVPVGTVQTVYSTRPMEKVTVSHMFKIMGYSVDKKIGKGNFIESTIFSVSGYDWSIKYYPNGCNQAEVDDISIYLHIKSKSDCVKAQANFTILDQGGCALPLSKSTLIGSFNTDLDCGNKSFCKRAEFESSIKDDCFVIKSVITVFKVLPVKPIAQVVVPVGAVETICCTRPVEKVTVAHMFKIMGYSLDKDIGKGNSIESTIFSVGGYDWNIRYYPNGNNLANDDDISIYLCIKTKSESAKAQFNFTFTDQSGCSLLSSKTSEIRNFSTDSHATWGFQSFCKRAELESNIKDDCFVIKTVVTIFKVSPTEPTAQVVLRSPGILLGAEAKEQF